MEKMCRIFRYVFLLLSLTASSGMFSPSPPHRRFIAVDNFDNFTSPLAIPTFNCHYPTTLLVNRESVREIEQKSGKRATSTPLKIDPDEQRAMPETCDRPKRNIRWDGSIFEPLMNYQPNVKLKMPIRYLAPGEKVKTPPRRPVSHRIFTGAPRDWHSFDRREHDENDEKFHKNPGSFVKTGLENASGKTDNKGGALHRITHVVGGHRASSGQFPSMVMFVLDDDVPMCGGSILNARWVLSAGHCLTQYRNNPRSVRAFTGRTITNIRVSEPSSRSYTVIKIVPHEKLRRPAHGNDISVVKLDKDIIFNANTKPVKLPYTHAEDPPAGAVLTLPGYGVTSVDGPLAPQMQYVTMKYVSDKECQSLLRAYARSLVIVPAQLCAGGEAGKDGCQGDSGGPLFDSSGVQVGIVSYGFGCGSPNTPGVYTQTSHFLPWIKRNTNF